MNQQKDNIGLVQFAQQALKAKTGYVYGTLGQVCTSSLLNSCAARNALAAGHNRKTGERWLGHRVVDCIGLIKYYLMSDAYGQNPQYCGKYDQNADANFKAATKKGPIASLPEIPGLLLHASGHVGVYIGGGWAIEARGVQYGVVKTHVKSRGWTHWYKCPWITYSGTVKSDTTENMVLPHGGIYTVKLTSGHKPYFTVGNGEVLQTRFVRQNGCTYFFSIKATGKPGEGTGIYADKKLLFAVKIAEKEA